MHPLALETGRLLGESVDKTRAVHGSNLSEVVCIDLQSGRQVIAKNGTDPMAEAAMLTAMAASGAPVPRVLAVNAAALVLEKLPDDGSLGGDTWRVLARAVHKLHRQKGKTYGWNTDYAFGRVVIHNNQQDNWCRFWAENRLLSERNALPGDLVGRLESLSNRLGDFIPQKPKPSLLHGDLWTGNVLTSSSGAVALIDPASYFGDPEVDLAMLCLFGSPSDAFWEVYGPRDAGWPERCAIYQLWPAIVHLQLFGSSYTGLCDRLLRALGC
ncbi:MAG: phosphotransferase [Rhodobacteraceae bacterium]|nr:phosphotransferase [Paracoccaceae bacterium]